MICIDVGSGYNPKDGYLKCDFNYGCDFYGIEEIPDNYVDKFHIRNTLHHIRDLNEFAKILYEKQKDGGQLKIIDCRKEYYDKNYFLDFLWYRFVFLRKDIFISKQYRNLKIPFILIGYILERQDYDNEKVILTFKKKKL